MASWPPAWLTPVDPEAVARGDGDYAIAFAETFGTIGKDGIAGRVGNSLVLRDWQKELLRRIYARDEQGGFVARTCLVGLPRKNGKSALSSASIALYDLFAGGVQGAEIVVAAAEKEQARIVFGEAKRMIENTELSELATIYKDSIYVPSTNSVMKVLSAEAYSKEGLNVSTAIIDELHAHPTRDLYDVLSLSMGARGSLGHLVSITTAGRKSDSRGDDSIAFTEYQRGKLVATGEQPDPSFFMAWWEAPADADHRDPEVWALANPGLGDLIDVEDMASAVKRTPEAEFRTKRLNQWVNTKEAWLPAGVWQALGDDFEMLPSDEYVLGFDGSWKNDSTALVAVILPRFEGDKTRVKYVAAWEKNFALDDDSWIVDKEVVSKFVMDWYDKYPNMREMPCDPSFWENEMFVWQDYGIPVVEYKNTPQRTIPATSKLYEAIMNKKFVHDRHPALQRHIDNCILKQDAKLGARLTKDFRNPKLKIDLAIALLMAYDRASSRIEEVVVPQFIM